MGWIRQLWLQDLFTWTLLGHHGASGRCLVDFPKKQEQSTVHGSLFGLCCPTVDHQNSSQGQNITSLHGAFCSWQILPLPFHVYCFMEVHNNSNHYLSCTVCQLFLLDRWPILNVFVLTDAVHWNRCCTLKQCHWKTTFLWNKDVLDPYLPLTCISCIASNILDFF